MHTKLRSSAVLSLPVSLASIRNPKKLAVLGIAGSRRHGDGKTNVLLTVRCGCFRVFEASSTQIEQGLVTCCNACAFNNLDASASVRAPRVASCGRRA